MISKAMKSPVAAAGLLGTACLLALGTPAHAAAPTTTTVQSADGPVTCSSTGTGRARVLATDVADALRGRRSTVSISLDDRGTGTTCALAPQRQYDAASVAKPIVLGALLRARDGQLSPRERELATKMIVESDNDATSALWKELSTTGADGATRPTEVEQFLKAAHMDATVPGARGAFGLTRVTSADLARLLRVFRGEDSVLTPAEGSYALGLMHDVRTDQRWGTPAAAPQDAEVHVKNGWLQRSEKAETAADRGDWRINSMAAFTGNGHDYDLVVLTQNNRAPSGRPAREGYRYGIATVEDVAKAVHNGLAAEPAAATAPEKRVAPAAAPPEADQPSAAARPRRSPDLAEDGALDAVLAVCGLTAAFVGHRMLMRSVLQSDCLGGVVDPREHGSAPSAAGTGAPARRGVRARRRRDRRR